MFSHSLPCEHPTSVGGFVCLWKNRYSIVLRALTLVFSRLCLEHTCKELFCFGISFWKDSIRSVFCTWVAVRLLLETGHCLWDYILSLLCLGECWSFTQHVTGVCCTEKSASWYRGSAFWIKISPYILFSWRFLWSFCLCWNGNIASAFLVPAGLWWLDLVWWLCSFFTLLVLLLVFVFRSYTTVVGFCLFLNFPLNLLNIYNLRIRSSFAKKAMEENHVQCSQNI